MTLHTTPCPLPRAPRPVNALRSPVFQAESEDIRHAIIPLLHTLMYVLTKVSVTPRVRAVMATHTWQGQTLSSPAGDTQSLPGRA